mmetsp:Transcript_4321/g.5437  ORF Transcript_4321/g.5437 Transcript_4321/m.5437 type:complete len:463 (+) Transcript_4321:3-1391(+)
MSFLRYSDTQEADASEMLSKDCFHAWISSRTAPVMHPEAAFRTALIGHLCAADQRKPFPPDVEKSLLYELRKEKIWNCFQGRGSGIGIRGLRIHGYHEARFDDGKFLLPDSSPNCSPIVNLVHTTKIENVKNNKNVLNDIDVIRVCSAFKKRAETTEGFGYMNDVTMRNIGPDHRFFKRTERSCESLKNNVCGESLLLKIAGGDLQKAFVFAKKRKHFADIEENYSQQKWNYRDRAYALQAIEFSTKEENITLTQTQECTVYDEQLRKTINELVHIARNPFTPSGRFALTVLRFFGKNNVMKFLRRTQTDRINFCTSGLYYMLNLNPDSDPRITKAFILPRKEESFFEESKVTTKVTVNMNDLTIVKSENAVPIYGETGVSKPLIHYATSNLEQALSMTYCFPILLEKGECWTRTIIQSKDSKSKVILAYATVVKNSNCLKLSIQDVSEKFHNLLELPPLFF